MIELETSTDPVTEETEVARVETPAILEYELMFTSPVTLLTLVAKVLTPAILE